MREPNTASWRPAGGPWKDDTMKMAGRFRVLVVITASCGGVAVSAPSPGDGGVVRPPGAPPADPSDEVPVPFCDSGAAEYFLRRYCASCHDEGAQSQADFSFVLDVAKLTTATSCTHAGNRYVVPGDPEGSELYQRVASGAMPPKQVDAVEGYARPSVADVSVLHAWIAECLGPAQGATCSSSR